ncbi:MAG TPA: ATP-dependent zinc metalloprotease FtsH [Pirellulales bacterium]|jgi:cell division protease FtsH|nr:ATP-dependent zinc metalloprotease FtsH [Pirellulales bacterium]
MESKRDVPGRKGPEKRSPPTSNNFLWVLVAIGTAVLFVIYVVPLKQELDLPYGRLVQLIEQGAPSKNHDASIRIDGNYDAVPATYVYSNLTDLKVGPEEIQGNLDRRVFSRSDAAEAASPAPTTELAGKENVPFRTGRRGFETTDGSFEDMLRKNGFTDFRGEEKPGPLASHAPLFVVTALMLLVVWIFLRRMGGAGSPMAFGRSRGKMYAQEDIGVTFEDVAGIDEAVDELREVVEFLKNPEKFQILGGRIPKGLLLVGPPGTGKTLLAKAIAGEAGVPFFSLSGSDFVEMFVGVGAARVRDMFQQAESKAPCIIFIDELDALGKTRGSSVVGGHDEREQTLNALLVEMDGFETNSGVIVLAATNRPETLDPALLRPGRFDRHVLVDRPDVRGREQILSVHVQNVKLDGAVNVKEVARITSGFVGADLANLVNEAALLAARKGKSAVGMEEFNEGVERVTAGLEKKQRIIHQDEKQRVAYHESGHALVAYSLPNTDPVHKVSIIPRGLGALGYVMQRPEGDRYLMTQGELESRIQVLLAGTIAEEMTFSDVSTGAQNDLERASEIARSMVMDYGMSRMGRVNYRESARSPFLAGGEAPRERSHSEQTAREIDEQITSIINVALERVRRMLETRRPALEALAQRLIEREVIDSDELRQIIEENSPAPQIVPGTGAERKRTSHPAVVIAPGEESAREA